MEMRKFNSLLAWSISTFKLTNIIHGEKPPNPSPIQIHEQNDDQPLHIPTSLLSEDVY